MRLNTIERKKFRVRKKLKSVSKDRYRLSVSRSTKNISAQIIDDVKNITLVSASSIDKEIRGQKKNRTHTAIRILSSGYCGGVGAQRIDIYIYIYIYVFFAA